MIARWFVLVLFVVTLMAGCGGGGRGGEGSGSTNLANPEGGETQSPTSISSNDKTEELRDQDSTNDVVQVKKSENIVEYDLKVYKAAEPALSAIENNSVPKVLEENGALLVLDISSWPTDWTPGVVISVEMPTGLIEYKRLLAKVELEDGRFAVVVAPASVLEVISDGTFTVSADFARQTPKRILFRRAGEIIEIFNIDESKTIKLIDKENFVLFKTDESSPVYAEGKFTKLLLQTDIKFESVLKIDRVSKSWFEKAIDAVSGLVESITNVVDDVTDALGIDVDDYGIIKTSMDKAKKFSDQLTKAEEVVKKLDAIWESINDRKRIKKGLVLLDGNISGEVQLIFQSSGSWEYLDDNGAPYEVELGSILIPISGPIPIFLEFTLVSTCSVSVSGEFNAQAGGSLKIPVYAKILVEDGEFKEYGWPSVNPNINFEPPTIEAEVSASAKFGLQIESGITVAKIVSASVDPTVSIVFDADVYSNTVGANTCSQLAWDMYFEVDADLEAELDILDMKKTWDVPWETYLFKGTDPNGEITIACNYVWYQDLDGDKYTNGQSVAAPERPEGYYLEDELLGLQQDCDDENEAVYPGAEEVCGDGKDNDCDGQIDEGCEVAELWYADMDGDGYSDGTSQEATTQPSGYYLASDLVATSGDCDDMDENVHPGASEVAGDGIDQDCDGVDLQLTAYTWYKDADGDGYSDGTSQEATTQPSGYYLASDLVATSGDCDDTDENVYPGAEEVLGDGVDQNCDGVDATGQPGTSLLPIVGSVETPGNANGLAVSRDGRRVFVADDKIGLQVVDVDDPANPVIVGSVKTPGRAYAVVLSVDDRWAFVVDDTAGLQVVDVGDPSDPVLVGSVDTPGRAEGVALSLDGRWVFIADALAGLQVVDVRDPMNPVIVGSVDTPGYAKGVSVSVDGRWVFVADGRGDLQVVDVSDPVNPVIVGSMETPGKSYSIAFSEDGLLAFVADYGSGLQVVDMSDPTTPTIMGSVKIPGWACGVVLSANDQWAFVAALEGGLHVVDVSDPTDPVLVASVDTPRRAWGLGLSPDGRWLFIGDLEGGLQIVDVSEFSGNGSKEGGVASSDSEYIFDFEDCRFMGLSFEAYIQSSEYEISCSTNSISGDKSLSMSIFPDSTSGGIWLVKTFNKKIRHGKVVVYVMVESSPGNVYYHPLQLWEDETLMLGIEFYHNGLYVASDFRGVFPVTIEGVYQKNKWYKFEVEWYEDGTYDLWVDGVKVVSDGPLGKNYMATNKKYDTGIDKFAINLSYASSVVYIDGITIVDME